MYILVDRVDLAVLKAIRYARSLRPTEIRAVHVMVDAREAKRLAAQWDRTEVGDLALEMVECPDRRISRAVLELVNRRTAEQHAQVTLLIPERNYSPVLGRLLHRRTADHIARAVGRLPYVVATIVPFDVAEAHEELNEAASRRRGNGAAGRPGPPGRPPRGARPPYAGRAAARVSPPVPAAPARPGARTYQEPEQPEHQHHHGDPPKDVQREPGSEEHQRQQQDN
jgi:hypothetical protein